MNEVGLYGPGGGRVGAVLLSKYIKPGTVTQPALQPLLAAAQLRGIFGLAHLGDAQQPQVHSFGSDVYTQPRG